jgi:anti-sigma regulatory factor (Ser/Thr protein kinase)
MAETSVSRVELDADLVEVAAARRFVRAMLGDVPPAVSADAQLIASELVTNAVEHGRGSSVIMELHRRDAEVDVMVESVGPAPDVGEVEQWRVASVDEITGRGLGIIRNVASRVDVRRVRGRLVITATLAI